MKIAIVILILITIIIILFQYKSLQKFQNICIYKNNELKKMEIEKDNIKSISDIIDNIYDIAVKINDKSNAQILLNTNYNSASIKKNLEHEFRINKQTSRL